MLITFKSKAFANITMFGEVGLQLLEMMGFGKNVPGAIMADDVPVALENLNRALARIPEQDTAESDPEDEQPAVSLHLRAVPLLKMLQAAAADEAFISWD